MKEKYGEYEQVNGAVANRLQSECDKKDAEIERLRRDCAEAYQCVGAWIDADESGGWIESRDKRRLLVNLKAAADGRSRPHDDWLPWPT